MWQSLLYSLANFAALTIAIPDHSPLTPRQDSDSALNATTNLGGFLRQCTRPATDKLPNYSECVNVFERIPFDPQRRSLQLHIDLPKTFTSGKCEVTFDAMDGRGSDSSWLSLHLAAMHLAEGCQASLTAGQNRQWLRPRTGGIMTNIGEDRNIMVRIGKPGRMPNLQSLGSNATIVDDEESSDGSEDDQGGIVQYS